MQPLKVGQWIDVYRVVKQPHDSYPEIGKTFTPIFQDDRIIHPPKICEFSDIYYYPHELKYIGQLIIKSLK